MEDEDEVQHEGTYKEKRARSIPRRRGQIAQFSHMFSAVGSVSSANCARCTVSEELAQKICATQLCKRTWRVLTHHWWLGPGLLVSVSR